jgi:DNA-binding NarL/FixJ family response regulator
VESPTIRWAIELGVDGLIWSDRVEDCLELTLRAVHADQVVVPRDILQRIRTRELTNREKQALSMVIMGLTNLEIAQKLFISENTVKSHLNTAYKKLGVHSRAEAQRLIADPDQGLGTGILAITAPGLSRGRPPKKG